MLLPRLLLLLAPALLVAAAGRLQPPPGPAAGAASSPGMALPPHFEPNRGQADARVRFLSRGGRHALFLTDAEAVLRLTPPSGETAVVRTRLLGARPPARTAGVDELSGRVHYFLGRDPARWRANIPLYAGVRAEGVYPGVDLHYYGRPGALEYDFVVAPGAEPGQVRLAIAGAERVDLDEAGDLRLRTPAGDVVQRKPVAYQERQGRREIVAAAYRVTETPEGAEVAFALGEYDRERPLVIDPVINFSTLLGGSDADFLRATAVDSQGSVYAAGSSLSTDFPAAGAVQPVPGGGQDAVLVKVDPDGPGLLFATYLGGSGLDSCQGVALDAIGLPYVAGLTESADFPVVFAVQPATGGLRDAFVARLTANGAVLDYSTYLGGTQNDAAEDIAVRADGTAYVTGQTESPNFPVVNAAQPAAGGREDFFVTAIHSNPASGVLYSTYIGGTGVDTGSEIAVDGTGRAHVIGSAGPGFPVMNAVQPAHGGGSADAAIVRLSATGAVQYSTLLGGAGNETAGGIAVDASGGVLATGSTDGSFPVVNALQPTYGGGAADAWVARLNGDGTAWSYASYLGGSDADIGRDVAVTPAGSPLILGVTSSSNFPTVDAIPGQGTHNGVRDGFLTRLNGTGTAAVYSTYLGGSGTDEAHGLAPFNEHRVAVVGGTQSGDFPVRDSLANPAGGFDGFLTIVAAAAPPAAPSNLTAVALPGRNVGLSWQDNSADEDGFEVERRVGGGAWTAVGGVGANQTSLLDVMPPVNVPLTYRVRASSPNGLSRPSSEAMATIPLPPAAPSLLDVQAAGLGRVRIRWTDNSSNEEGFQIERRAGAGEFELLALSGAGTTEFVTEPQTPGVLLAFRVAAFNAGGVSAPSGAGEVTLPLPPAAPSGLTAVLEAGLFARLNWLDNSSDEEGFLIDRMQPGQAFETVASPNANVTTALLAGPTGVALTFRVRAFNSGGASAPSDTAVLTIPVPPPAPAPPGDLTVVQQPGSAFVLLNWTDNSSNEDGFVIDRRLPGGEFQATDGTEADVATALLEVTPGVATTFRVRAHNLGGVSAPTNEVTITVPPVPAAPTGLTVVIVTAVETRLEWTDASENEEGFVVEADAGSGYVDAGTTGAGTAAFSHAKLAQGAAVTYRVRAFNITGRSAPSGAVAIQIPAGGRLKIAPARLGFGTVALGQRRQKRLTLSNTGRGPLAGTVSAPGAPFRILSGEGPFTLAPRGKLQVTVEFHPKSTGTSTRALRVTSTDTARQRVDVPATGRGR